MNKDCVLDENDSGIEEGGTLTLCRVGMDKTAPLILDRASGEGKLSLIPSKAMSDETLKDKD